MAGGDSLKGLGYLALSLGFGIAGVELLRGSSDTKPLGNKRSGLGLSTVSDASKMKVIDVQNITERVDLLLTLIKKGGTSNVLYERTREITSQKMPDGQGGLRWTIPEKDCWGEVAWVFNAIRNPNSKYAVRYTHDMLLRDTFSEAERTLLKTHGGDCDDYAVIIGSMLMSLGHQVRVRVIGTIDQPDQDFTHVYLVTPTQFYKLDAPWAAVDASMQKPVGWEAPGASRVVASGRPAGIVTRVKDYDCATGKEVPPIKTIDMTNWVAPWA